tara:strand:- start:300 stop:713 length:414 start_codon:yes stop_codon:yes gene_type:complete
MSNKIKEKKEWISFHEDGQRWMICKSCQSDYVKCGEKTVATTCSMCVIRIDMIKFPETIKKQKVSSGKPAGWHFMSEFVDKDGNVFHKGKEQPKLKGTLKPTKVKARKKKKKLTEEEKLQRDLKNWKKRLKAKRGSK